MTGAEGATYLRLSCAQVCALCQRRELPHIRMGKSVRVRQTDLEKWLQGQTVLPVQWAKADA